MVAFVGRHGELAVVQAQLKRVQQRGEGVLLAVRGRRQIGKSRFAEEFLRRAHAPSAFFAATRRADPAGERAAFAAAVAESDLGAADVFGAVRADDWLTMFRLLADRIDVPSVLVIDELPYLLSGDPALEGVLQTAWDRFLSRAPLLLLVLGSDLSMMEALGAHGSPLYGRVRELQLRPLSVQETGQLLRLSAADAFDAQVVTGGFPRVAVEWQGGWSTEDFLRAQLADSTAPLVVVGERIMSAEFPDPLQAGDVLRAIGSGERTFGSLRGRLGLSEGSLTRTLRVLVEQARVVSAERPLSTAPSRDVRYRVSDAYLRFWLRFIEPVRDLLLRGRSDAALDRVLVGWPAYRGAAVEPLVRQALERLLPDDRLGPTQQVGRYWTRNGDVEVDLVGADRQPRPTSLTLTGSIKWGERQPFDRHDLANLAALRSRVPGADSARLIGVSRAGFTTAELDAAFTPDDLIGAGT